MQKGKDLDILIGNERKWYKKEPVWETSFLTKRLHPGNWLNRSINKNLRVANIWEQRIKISPIYFHVAINNNRMRPFEFDARSRGKIPTMFIFEDFLKKHMV